LKGKGWEKGNRGLNTESTEFAEKRRRKAEDSESCLRLEKSRFLALLGLTVLYDEAPASVV
jgi:hypothetical protein